MPFISRKRILLANAHFIIIAPLRIDDYVLKSVVRRFYLLIRLHFFRKRYFLRKFIFCFLGEEGDM